MKCQNPECGKDTCVIFVNKNHEKLCDECYYSVSKPMNLSLPFVSLRKEPIYEILTSH